MEGIQNLEISKLIDAPVEQVYRSFMSSVALESWFSDFAELVPSVNGRFYVYWNGEHYAAGTLSEIVENQKISLTWRGQGESIDTTVDISFLIEDGKTNVTVLHSNLGTTGHWIESSKSIRSGWEFALNNLKSVLETGFDKRVYDQPMLGIYPNQVVDDVLIEKYDLPVTTGVQIGGVIEGSGAESVGLKADDVIFNLNGYDIKGFSDFAKAISNKEAGEVVELVFYRRNRQYSVEMELSRRPSPKIPNSATELASVVKKSYGDFNIEMDKIFVGVNDEEASFSPSSQEWSAKETLIHLLNTERWLQLAISCAITDQRTGGFINQLELIRAAAETYSLADLIAELKLSEQITVNMLVALPPNFVADKRRYCNFASSFGQGFAKHSVSHLPQIEAAITAAKKQ